MFVRWSLSMYNGEVTLAINNLICIFGYSPRFSWKRRDEDIRVNVFHLTLFENIFVILANGSSLKCHVIEVSCHARSMTNL